jgi:hypothetical protein
MKGRIISGVTPQNKMVSVNNRFGNSNIASQQGTTRVLFDSIELSGQTELRFFENAGTKNYPYTNIGSEGNRLNVGDTFVVQKIYFGVADQDPDTGAINGFTPGLGFVQGLYKGEFNFQIANSQVIKQLPLDMFAFASQNPTAVNNVDVAFDTFTDIVIPPLLEYIAAVRLATPITPAPGTSQRIYLFLEGSAGIIAPQTTF